MFPPTTPESVGLPSVALLALIDRLEREGHDPHSLIVLRDGREIAAGWWAPYARERVHRLYSLSKSFTSTAVGLAIDEGRLGLDDPVLGFFPDLAPDNPSENLRAMRVRDLLTMACGQDEDASGEFRKGGDWARAFLSRPVPHEPGSFFLYNSGATYMLSAILARVTGESLLDYLRPRLLDPLGVGPARWETDPDGIAVGGWGLYVTTDALARFGQLLLQRGQWDGRQLVPEAWIDEATAKQVDNSRNENPDWRQGYGFQFWQSRHGFRGDGAFGQICAVLPERRLVVAITSATDEMQGMLDALWEELFASLQDGALPEDAEASAALDARLASLSVPHPEGDDSAYDGPFALRGSEGEFRIGLHGWEENPVGLGAVPGPMAAWGTFEGPGRLVARCVALESTESMEVRFELSKGGVGAEYKARGTWGASQGELDVTYAF